ncbi:TPA: hypothetical protein ACH3X3_006751 [Trebouxia sp. C0006]
MTNVNSKAPANNRDRQGGGEHSAGFQPSIRPDGQARNQRNHQQQRGGSPRTAASTRTPTSTSGAQQGQQAPTGPPLHFSDEPLSEASLQAGSDARSRTYLRMGIRDPSQPHAQALQPWIAIPTGHVEALLTQSCDSYLEVRRLEEQVRLCAKYIEDAHYGQDQSQKVLIAEAKAQIDREKEEIEALSKENEELLAEDPGGAYGFSLAAHSKALVSLLSAVHSVL